MVARNSSFAYKGRPVDARLVAQDLGVRYVLEGTVRRAGDRLRITAQLVDGATGAQLWGDHLDGALAEVFDFQDRITESVATLIEPHIQRAELERSRRERPGSLASYDVYLRTLTKILSETESDNAEAFALLTERLAHDPDDARLLSHAAWLLEHRHSMGWPALTPDDVARCGELARRALEHAAGDGDGDVELRHRPAADGQGLRLGRWRCFRRRWRPTPTTSWSWSGRAWGTCIAGTSTRPSPFSTVPTG